MSPARAKPARRKRRTATTRPARRDDPRTARASQYELEHERGFEAFVSNAPPVGNRFSQRALVGLYLIQRIGVLLHRATARSAQALGLHATDLTVLALLHRTAPAYCAPAADLQNALAFTAGGMTRRIDRLGAAGLVERREHPTDRRAWMVALTPRGRQLIASARRTNANRSHIAAASTALAGAQWNELVRMLEKLLAVLGEDEAKRLEGAR